MRLCACLSAFVWCPASYAGLREKASKLNRELWAEVGDGVKG